jgi:CRISPR-associated protein Cas2
MLMVVAYDIVDPRRLRQVAKHGEDYGVRVQFSVFECRLEAAHFEEFWSGLMDLIDPEEDRVVAYRICASCAKEIRSGGVMQNTEERKVVCYVF